jgi:uncharacterized protein
VTGVLAASEVVWVGRSLREAFFMFWETLWPLVLGFGLAGAVQAFVPRQQLQHKMGDHRPTTMARASGFGMVSSSCSYAASAMAKSLFSKGADFVTAMAFMIASTNLVVELGIVLIVLMGWQFAAAEFVGGPIMIALLGLVGGWLFARTLTDAARRRLDAGEGAGHEHQEDGHDRKAVEPAHAADARHDHQAHDHEDMAGISEARRAELEAQPWGKKLRSPAAWSDAATYSMADLTMLRRELVIGYVVAGFLAVLVPNHVWNAVFLHGHGFWTSVENAIVGPLIAILSFVCSIGNVPLAAALWRGGIAFGGVVAFLFADLIAFPLLLIYWKYYGRRLTLRILAGFWAIMALGGLIVEGLFSAAGLIPQSRSARIVSDSFRWDYTTILNFVFLGVFAGLWWLSRHRDRLGGGRGYAIDPVCGMQVRTDDAPARTVRDGRTFHFCSDHCAARFAAHPDRHEQGSDRTRA